MDQIPATGLMRLSQILGDKKRGITPLVPVSKSTWWAGVKDGRFPRPVKLGERVTCWHAEDIRALINQAGATGSTV
jgi:predicted DNA-binding transcriptional regulator AlpA